MSEIVIKSEEDVLRLLQDLIDNKKSLDPESISFDGWPKLILHLEGEKYHQTITPTVMHGLIDLQRELYRAYALARYNTTGTRNLKKEEREELEIIVEVEDGSSTLEIDLQQILLKFVELVGGKMEPVHVVTVVLGVAGLYFSSATFKYYLDYRRQIREAEIKSEEQKQIIHNMKFASEEETKRAKIMSDLVKKDYRLENLERSAYDVHTSLIKSASVSEQAEIQGAQIDGDVAHILSQNARRKSEEIRIDGRFRLLKVDSRKSDEFRVTVRNVDSNEEIDAVVQDVSLTAPNKKILQEAEWARKMVLLKINAKQIGDEIRSATIIDVQRIDEE